MIRELLYELYSRLRQVTGSGAVIILYIAAAVFIIRGLRKKKEDLPVLLSPLAAIGAGVSRLFDLIREKIAGPAAAKAATVFAVCLTVLAVVSSGTLVFSNELSEPAENSMHIPEDILEAATAVKNDSKAPSVLTMPGWDRYFSSYSSSFILPCSSITDDAEYISDEDDRILKAQLSEHSPDMKKVARIADKKGCNYIVLSKDLWPEVPVTKFGYDEMLELEGCIVYRKVSTP